MHQFFPHLAKRLTPLTAAAAIAGASPVAAHAAPTGETIADISWVELEREAKSGTVALWAIGSIEEHGAHLPLGTDSFVAQAQVSALRKRLKKMNIRALAVPTYHWGVNRVTGAFPGSLQVRREAMTMVLGDVVASLQTAGFKHIFLITGHYDAEHNRAIAAAVAAGNTDPSRRVTFVVPSGLAERLGFVDGREGIAVAAFPPGPGGPTIDLHAGEVETSMMLSLAPSLVRQSIARKAPATDLTEQSVREWRKGGETARRITPEGYLGAPARATRSKGRLRLREETAAYAAAIGHSLESGDFKAEEPTPKPAGN